MTHVPSITITDSGLNIPNETDILNGVLADFNDAFGGGLNLNLETPQGQLASSLAAIIADKNYLIADLVNQLNPDYSDGLMQDAIAKIYFLERKKAVASVVECELIGLPGTIIPQGFAVLDDNNNRWTLQTETSILFDGRVLAKFVCQGAVSAVANSVNRFVTTIVGLDRISNPQDALIGREIESREDFRQRRQMSVAKNAHGTPQSVYANVAQLDGVSDVYVVDNPKHVAVTQNGQTIQPHSIYVAVVGGKDKEIAETILRYAGNGCDFTGNTDITIYDDTYTEPKPTYQVSFMRPSAVPIYFRIKIKHGSALGYQDTIKKAIIKAFNGENKAGIGGTVYAMRYVSAISQALSTSQILDIEVGLSKSRMSNSASVGIHQYPVISADNIEVVQDD